MIRAWKNPFKVKSLLAREAAGRIAQAASLGLITTKDHNGTFGDVWYVTAEGIWFLNE